MNKRILYIVGIVLLLLFSCSIIKKQETHMYMFNYGWYDESIEDTTRIDTNFYWERGRHY